MVTCFQGAQHYYVNCAVCQCVCVCISLCSCSTVLKQSRCVLVVGAGHAPRHISSDLLLWHVCMLEMLHSVILSWAHAHTYAACYCKQEVQLCVCVWSCVYVCLHWFTATLFDISFVNGIKNRREEGEKWLLQINICSLIVLMVKYAVAHKILEKVKHLLIIANH